MAIKTFSDGVALPASDINSFLTNSGLVYIGTKTMSGTLSFFDSVFTSAYDNYRIIITATSNTNMDALFRFRVGGVDNSSALYQYAMTGFYTGTVNNAAGTAQTSIGFLPSLGGGRTSSCTIEVFQPFTTNTWKPLNASMTYCHSAVGVIVRNLAGALENSTAFDGFSISGGAATMSGTITVYGYRKA